MGDDSNALKELENVFVNQTNMIDVMLKQSISRAQSDYFEAKAELLSRDRERRKFYNTIAILVLLILVIGAVAVIQLIHKHYNNIKSTMSDVQAVAERQLHELRADIDKSRLELDNKEKLMSKLKSDYIHNYREQFSQLDRLCSEYWYSEHRGDKNRIYNEVQYIVSSISIESGKDSDFESHINSGFDDVMKKLRSDFPEYKEADFRFISYVIVGFETKTISMLMGISCSSIYTKKSRMKDKILSSGSENVELYRMCLG